MKGNEEKHALVSLKKWEMAGLERAYVEERGMRGEKMAVACLGRAKCCVLLKQASQQYAHSSALVSPKLSHGAGCKGFVMWISGCANEAMLPAYLRCCIHVVLCLTETSSWLYLKTV